MHRSSVTKLETSVELTKKTHESALRKIRLPLLERLYPMSEQWDDGPYDVVSFIRKMTYHVRISLGISLSAMLTVVNLVDTGSGPGMHICLISIFYCLPEKS